MARSVVPPAAPAPRAEPSAHSRYSPSVLRAQASDPPESGQDLCETLANSKMLGYCFVTTPPLLALQHGPLGKGGPTQ